MICLGAAELRRLQECIFSLYSLDSLQEFPRRAIHAVLQLVAADKAAYNEICLRPQRLERFTDTGEPYTPEQLAIFERHIHEHPLVAYCHEHPEHPPIRMSDFLTRRQFHHTGLYAEFFRPVGVEYQMAVGIATRPGIVVGIALNRKLTDFSAAEKTLLEYLCPHLQQAYRNAQAMDLALRQRGQAEELLESVAPGMAIVSATGRIHQATPAARSMLEKYYRSGGGSDQLPEEVTRWLRGQVALLGDGDPTRPCLPLIEEGRGHWLTIRLLVRPGESHCLVLQEHSIEQRIAAYMRLGLTARQAQVLAWMSIGKSDSEIAILLSTSPRTIEKHLEHIYDRLDVPSRLQAVVRALEIFR